MKNKSFSFIRNIFIILVVLCLVLFFSLKDNYSEIVNSIVNMNPFCVLVSIIILCLSRVLMALTHYMVIDLNNENISYWKCLQINFIVLFFHGVTPFAGGGQPMEVYYLHNEKIPVTKSTNITLQNFIIYQIAFVLIGVLALLFNYHFKLFGEDTLIKRLVILGFTINILVLFVTFILSFGKKTSKFVLEKIIHIGSKFRIIKDEAKVKDKFNNYLSSFYNNALELRKHKLKVLNMICIDFISILILYSMPFFIALGLGIKLNVIYTMVTTAYVMTIGSFVPIPGGTGGVEYGFVFFFGYLISGSVVKAIMLIWRFVSYYLAMIFGAIALSLYRKRDN